MFLIRLYQHLRAAALTLSWPVLMVLVLVHGASTWLLFFLAGEDVASPVMRWLYFYVTTATTVGYGDYSPTTDWGQLIAALWLLPGSIMLFASFIGKAATFVAEHWRRAMCGKGNYGNLKGHTLIIGWHGEPTEAMVDILLKDAQFSNEIVLCVVKEMENPLPGRVKFVRGESFSNPQLLARAGVRGADRVIIYDYADERVATIALSVYRLKHPGCHVVAHCDNQTTAAMLRDALPGIECTQGLSIEMLVRSAMDKGISRVVNELLALDHGATQFQQTVPGGLSGPPRYGDLLVAAKQHADITLLGLCKEGGNGRQILNPPVQTPVCEGDVLYYMGPSRLSQARLAELIGALAAPREALAC